MVNCLVTACGLSPLVGIKSSFKDLAGHRGETSSHVHRFRSPHRAGLCHPSTFLPKQMMFSLRRGAALYTHASTIFVEPATSMFAFGGLPARRLLRIPLWLLGLRNVSWVSAPTAHSTKLVPYVILCPCSSHHLSRHLSHVHPPRCPTAPNPFALLSAPGSGHRMMTELLVAERLGVG